MARTPVPLRAAVLLDRPRNRVLHALLRPDVHRRTGHIFGYQLGLSRPEHPALQAGDRLRFHRGHRAVQFDVRLDDGGAPFLSVVARAGGPRWLDGATIGFTLAETGAGTLVTVEFLGLHPTADLLPGYRSRVLGVLRHLLGILTLAVHESQVVVAAAIVQEGRVLATRRTYPAALAGKWELPGGKVDPGETEPAALVREIGEELAVTVTPGERLGDPVQLDAELVLHTYLATLVAGTPQPVEHDRMAWLGPDELDSVDWLPADLALLPALRKALQDRG